MKENGRGRQASAVDRWTCYRCCTTNTVGDTCFCSQRRGPRQSCCQFFPTFSCLDLSSFNKLQKSTHKLVNLTRKASTSTYKLERSTSNFSCATRGFVDTPQDLEPLKELGSRFQPERDFVLNLEATGKRQK